MFDNPEEELKKLEEQLLAAENPEDDFESFYQDILQEFGTQEQKPAQKKTSAPKKQTKTTQPKKAAGKSAAKTTGKSAGKTPAKKSKKKKKKKSVKGLVITLCLESAGILALIVWWLMRLL